MLFFLSFVTSDTFLHDLKQMVISIINREPQLAIIGKHFSVTVS